MTEDTQLRNLAADILVEAMSMEANDLLTFDGRYSYRGQRKLANAAMRILEGDGSEYILNRDAIQNYLRGL